MNIEAPSKFSFWDSPSFRCKQSDSDHISFESSESNTTVHPYTEHNSTDEECKLRNIDDFNTEIAE